MEVSLRQLQYFVAVADLGSVKAAAEACHVSASGVSLALSQLEATLGTQLTRRSKRHGTTLTPAGRAAAVQARRVLDDIDELVRSHGRHEGELVGKLQLGCSASLSPWLLPGILSYFATEHPSVTVTVSESDARELQQLLRDGLLDCCLIHKVHSEPGMDIVPIAPLRLHVVLPTDHPLAERDEIEIADLENEHAILLDHQPALSIAYSMFRSNNVELQIRWTSKNVETIRSLVARGLGFSLLIGRPSGDKTYEGLDVAYRKLKTAAPENAVVVCTPRDVRSTQLTRALIEACQSEFARDQFPTEGP